jgi:hypothetical protein
VDDINKALDRLCDTLQAWCAKQGLPYWSADELLMQHDLTYAQQQWLHTFSTLWELTT